MDTRFSVSQHLQHKEPLAATEAGRQRLVTCIMNFVAGTPMYPGAYEQLLLAQFVRGNLTIDQVIHKLEIHEEI